MIPNDLAKIAINDEGFLCCYTDWNESIGLAIAAQEQLKLTPAHFEVITLIRDYYQQHNSLPTFRKLVTLLQCKSIYLYELFPGSPMKRLCKIAGLPKPKHCT